MLILCYTKRCKPCTIHESQEQMVIKSDNLALPLLP